MRVQVVVAWEWIIVNSFNFVVQLFADILLELFKFFIRSPSELKKHFLRDLDWVSAFSDHLDLFFGSVGDTGVGHGMTMIPIGIGFHINWAVFFDVCTSPFDCFSHHKDVLGIKLEAWDLTTTCVELSVMSSSVLGGSHSVAIVFAEVNDWQFPETSHVGCFCELALYSRVLGCQGGPS